MSRSYRKPYFVDGYGSRSKRISKRHASRAVRHAEDVPNGKAYRKFFDPWNICDYRYRWDPEPYVWFNSWKNEFEVIEPSPYWKVGRK